MKRRRDEVVHPLERRRRRDERSAEAHRHIRIMRQQSLRVVSNESFSLHLVSYVSLHRNSVLSENCDEVFPQADHHFIVHSRICS